MIRTHAVGWTFQLVRLLRRESHPQLRESGAIARPELPDGCLKRYEEEIAQLRLENEYLRRSATMFGELAERLNDALRKARVAEGGRPYRVEGALGAQAPHRLTFFRVPADSRGAGTESVENGVPAHGTHVAD